MIEYTPFIFDFQIWPTEEKILTTVDRSWKVDFKKDRGAPATATFDKLASFIQNTDEGIKYFSGTATYTKTIAASADWFKKIKSCG